MRKLLSMLAAIVAFAPLAYASLHQAALMFARASQNAGAKVSAFSSMRVRHKS